jgi:threonine 3-dehydrogenase
LSEVKEFYSMSEIPSSMKAVVKAGPEKGLQLVEKPTPAIGDRDVLIKVKAASICGTDLHIYKWDDWARNRIRPPITVGHEFCGDVVARGRNVTNVNLGDFVSAESHIVCNSCALCLTGNGHICRNTQIIGVDRDGAFAEYISLPSENAWPNPPGTPPEIAVLMENFGNAVHTAFTPDLRAKKVLITGAGPVGIMTVAIVKALGARLILVTDISQYRLDLAKRMGADETINAASEDVVRAVRDKTEGEGVDVLLEMSGAPSAIQEGFSVLKYGGQAIAFGIPSKPLEFNLADLVIFKGINIQGIVGRRLWDTWFQERGLLKSGAVNLAPIVTHKFKIEEFDQAFATFASGESGKVMMTF